MHLHHGRGELVGDGVGFGHRAAGGRGPVAEPFGKRRLAGAGVHVAAEAGEVLADGARQDRAPRGLPIEVCHAQHGPLHVVFSFRHGALEDLGRHAQGLQLFDRVRKSSLADLGANVAVLHEVNGSAGMRAVGRRAAVQIAEHFIPRIAAAGRHAQHHRQQVVASRHRFPPRHGDRRPWRWRTPRSVPWPVPALRCGRTNCLRVEIEGAGDHRLPEIGQPVDRSDRREDSSRLAAWRRASLLFPARPAFSSAALNFLMSSSMRMPQGKSLE